MKKGCMIALGVLVVLIGAFGVSTFVGYKIANQRFGLSLAPEVHHETLATKDTRFRLVIYPLSMAPILAVFVPPDFKEGILSLSPEDLLKFVLPREVAVMGRTDLLGKKVQATLFMNEQRLGPLFKDAINGSEFFSQMKQIDWNPGGAQLPERGKFFAGGTLRIPEGVEEEILALWPEKVTGDPPTVSGGNHLELVIDNRQGDILAIAAAVVQANGHDWPTLRGTQYGSMAIGIIESIYSVRLTANFLTADKVKVNLRIESDKQRGPGLQFMISGLALPFLKDYLKNKQGIILEGEAPWNDAANTIEGDFMLTGVEAAIKKQMNIPSQ